MKRCPKCNQEFTDDLYYCLQDGTPLVAESYLDSPTLAMSNAPTVPIQGQTQAELPTLDIRPKELPKWPYIATGALAVALIAVGLVTFLPKFGSEKAQVNGLEPKVADEPKVAAPVANSTPERKAAAASNGATTAEAPNYNYASPTGRFSGDWISKMTSYGADVTITEVAGKIKGQIVWTLRSSPNPKKVNKTGTTAIEYVQGTYNPQTRMLDLEGFRKDDPNDIIILDKYHLSAAADNQTIIGKSIHGEFILKRQ